MCAFDQRNNKKIKKKTNDHCEERRRQQKIPKRQLYYEVRLNARSCASRS